MNEDISENVHKAYLHYREKLFEEAYSKLHSYSLAEDCVHDAFITLYEKLLENGAENINIPAFLLSVTRNIATKMFYSDIKESELMELHVSEEAEFDSPEKEVFLREKDALICSCLNRLPSKNRSAVLLHCIYNLNYGKTAQIVGGTAEGVKKAVHRSLEQLRKEFEKEGLMCL